LGSTRGIGMEYGNELIEATLEYWDQIIAKAMENEEFKDKEVVSLLYAKVILEEHLD
jgi:hypothetical protein